MKDTEKTCFKTEHVLFSIFSFYTNDKNNFSNFVFIYVLFWLKDKDVFIFMLLNFYYFGGFFCSVFYVWED